MSGPFRSFLPIEGEEEDRYCGYVDPSVSKLYLSPKEMCLSAQAPKCSSRSAYFHKLVDFQVS